MQIQMKKQQNLSVSTSVGTPRYNNEEQIMRRTQIRYTHPNWNCYICYQYKKIPFLKFAECQHKLVCLSCCEAYLKQCFKDYKNPKCFVQKCPANLYTKNQQISVFELISESLKQTWYIQESVLKLRESSRFGVLKQCRTPDCRGYISHFIQNQPRCILCKQQYCCQCWKYAHFNKKCSISIIDLPEDTVSCSVCQFKFTKSGGCNSGYCPKCKQNICLICGGRYSQYHTKCGGGIINYFFLPFQWIQQKLT